MKQPKTTLCFDLDGTLVDTAPDLLAALDYTLLKAGHKPSDHAHIRPIIGHGAKAMLNRALESDKQTVSTINDKEIDRLWHCLIEHYSIHIANQSQPYENVVETLETLKFKGFKLAVCTNKPMFLTEPLLDSLQLTSFFAAIKGADSYSYRKPDPRHLTSTIEAAGGTINDAIMIGDSKTDIDTARNANIPVIGVDFGYTDHPMHDLKPDHIMSHYDELQGLISKIIKE